MGKRSAAEAHNGHQHNCNGEPALKRTRYNGTQHDDLHTKRERNSSSSEHDLDTTADMITATDTDNKESPKPEFQLSRELVNGTVLTDIAQKQWRIGNPIGKGSFGEIFLASDNISKPVTDENAKYVLKIEPHSNGPLFVEIHCLLNTAKASETNPLPPGMPAYIASGSHYFKNTRYRFLVLQRFDRDLHSIIKNRKVDPKSVLILAVQILEVLEHLHDKGYCHSDIKAENLMISKCTYHKNQIYGNNNNNSVKDDIKNDTANDTLNTTNKRTRNRNKIINEQNLSKYKIFDDDHTNSDDDTNDDDNYKPPSHLSSSCKKNNYKVQFSGSNPRRSCRNDNFTSNTSSYQEMINQHYLRSDKKISYSQFFGDETSKSSSDDDSTFDEYISRRCSKLSKGDCKVNYKTSNNSSCDKNRISISKRLRGKDITMSSTSSSSNSIHLKNNDDLVTEDRIFLIDFGLASKFIDSNGQHRPFCMDQRRAHDGTLEFTSRDAHMGAHSRRSDLECLGYNLIFWSQGYLPWKENAVQQQQDKVHQMKEYLMSDIKRMLKYIYGDDVPSYLGDYMQYVGQLSYHERPDYEKCKRIFIEEYKNLNKSKKPMKLDVKELIKKSIDIREERENNNFFEMKNMKVIKNLGVIMPFKECNTPNRISPKNLRSKSDKISPNSKKGKEFSWTEVLSKDPDKIARDRAEKEFEREGNIDETPTRYQGNPTYAILEIQNRIKFKDRLAANESSNFFNDLNDSNCFKGYTKPMIDIIKKRNSSLMLNNSCNKSLDEQYHQRSNGVGNHFKNQMSVSTTPAMVEKSALASQQSSQIKLDSKMRHRKAGLRTVITPTKRGLDYKCSLNERRAKRTQSKLCGRKNLTNYINGIEDELSRSSMNSVASSNRKTSRSSSVTNSSLKGDATSSNHSESSNSSSSSSSRSSRTSDSIDNTERHNDTDDDDDDDENELINNHISVPVFPNALKRNRTRIRKYCKTKSSTLQNNKNGMRLKSKAKKKKSIAVKRKMMINNVVQEDEDLTENDYDYYPTKKRINDGNIIPIVTFKKRIKRTRSG